MKTASLDSLDDDLRSEYNLEELRLRKSGPGRNVPEPPMVRLEPDVVEVFPNAQAVNEALRFLIRATRRNSLQAD
jgi:hypothetical protein